MKGYTRDDGAYGALSALNDGRKGFVMRYMWLGLLALPACDKDGTDTGGGVAVEEETSCGEGEFLSGDECVEIAEEVCDDGSDNDGDGLSDCEDESCIGDAACPTEFAFEMSLTVTYAALGTGTEFEDVEESPAALIEASIEVEGTSTTSDWSMSCAGTLSGSVYGEDWLEADGGLAYASTDASEGVVLSWSLAGIETNVRWEEECMVTLQDLTLGLNHGASVIRGQDADGNWVDLFTGGTSSSESTDTSTVSRWEELTMAEPVTWTEVY